MFKVGRENRVKSNLVPRVLSFPFPGARERTLGTRLGQEAPNTVAKLS